MLSPAQLGEAGDAVAAVYTQIEAEMLDHLVETMVSGNVTSKTVGEIALLAQTKEAELRRIIAEHQGEISDSVLDTVERFLEAADADDRERMLTDEHKAPAQIVATAASLSGVLARNNLAMVQGAKRAFLAASVEAVTKVNAGFATADKAVHAAVRNLVRNGIDVVSYQDANTGKATVRNKVDVAVRRHVRTQISQAANDMAMERLERLDVKLVEVSSHADARPSHAEWQGRCYSLNGEVTIEGVTYPDFYLHCMSGALGDILGGVNCRHSFGPYRHGAPRRYEPDPKHPSGLPGEEVYEYEQQQRLLERRIREAKREVRGMQLLYENDRTPYNLLQVMVSKERLKRRQETMRDLIRDANAKAKPGTHVLTRKPNREWAGDMPKGVTIRKQKDLDSYLGSAAVVAKREAKGVSRSALEKAVRRELSGMDVKAVHFDLLSVRERDGIMSRAWAAIDSRLPSTKKASAGMHAIKQYMACKTKKDALKFARDELGFEAVSEALTLSELNEVNAAFYELMQRNPFMKGYVRDIKTGKMGACAHFAVRRIEIGPGKFSFKTEFKFDRNSLTNAVNECNTNCKPSPQLGGNVGWTLKHDASGIVAHEFAHAIEYKVTMKRLGFDPGDELDILQVAEFYNARGSVSKEIIKKAFERAGIEYNDANVMKHVSVYGAKNTRETLAEALSCEDGSNIVCNEIKRATQELLRSEGLI